MAERDRAAARDATPLRAPAASASRVRAPSPGSEGNQAVQRRLLAERVQAKLAVNAPGDEHEREADRAADLVMRMPDPSIQRKDLAGTIDEARKRLPETVVERKEDERKRDEKTVRRKEDDRKKEEEKPVVRRKEDDKRRKDEERAARKEDDKKKKDEKSEVRRKEESPRRGEDEERLQAKSDAGVPRVTSEVESRIRAQRGAGHPLSDASRAFFEPRFGHDLAAVRVHDDAEAASLANELEAQAFTVGNDVFFGEGRHQPGTEAGDRLLAHELTHTLQQTGGAPMGEPVQRLPTPPAQAPAASGPAAPVPAPGAGAAPAAPDATQFSTQQGRIIPQASGPPILRFDRIDVPSFKLRDRGPGQQAPYEGHLPMRRTADFARDEDTGQTTVWNRAMKRDPDLESAVTALKAKARTLYGREPADNERVTMSVPDKRAGPRRLLGGTVRNVAKKMVIPTWDKSGASHAYQVDHIVELQLAGWLDAQRATHWANQVENMELLDESVNMRSGNFIKNKIRQRVNDFVRLTNSAYGDRDAILDTHHVEFENPHSVGDVSAGANDSWTIAEIKAGAHVNEAVHAPGPDEMGGEGRVLVAFSEESGYVGTFRWPGAAIPAAEAAWLRPYVLRAKSFNTAPGSETTDQLGTLTLHIPDTPNGEWEPVGDVTLSVDRLPGARYAGTLRENAGLTLAAPMRKRGMSPLRIDRIEAREGLEIHGAILPDLPLFRGSPIRFHLRDGELSISKEFTLSDFKQIPRPFRITSSSLLLEASRRGFTVTGDVRFAIDNVGRGVVAGSYSNRTGFGFQGDFSFDTELFTRADVRLRYEAERWSAAGVLEIGPGKVRGIRRASVQVGYENEVLTLGGNADLDVPGVESADVRASYSEAAGLEIAGSATLGNGIPAVRSGRLEARVVRNPEGRYDVSARGTAVAGLPGLEAQLEVSYDNGAFLVQGGGAYQRGMLSGTVTVGATNKPLDEQGRPMDGPPGELKAYGGGQVTVRFSPWLQGTIGLRLLPNGEVEVTGTVALPSALDLFPAKTYERNLLTVGLDIPLVGVAVLGQRIGIFATIRGGVDFSAGVGPGQLRDTSLTVTYNPAREEQTRVQGRASLHVPARAGIRLFVQGGLGAGIPIVSGTAGLEVGGGLAIEGAVQAGVQVDWTPQRGLVLDAAAEIFAEPKLTFDLTGFARIEADLGFRTIELYGRRWRLAAFEYGSGLRLGVRMPIHYEEGRDFDVDWSQAQWTIPQVDPERILRGLVERIV